MLRIFLMSSLARDGMQGGGRTHSLFMFAILFSFVFLLASCTAKRVEVPTYEGADIQTVLSSKGAVRLIDSNFSIEFERDGGVLRGDAVLKLTPDALDLQVYSLGFLVAEVTSNDAVTRSDPPIDRNRLLMLVDGIRNSFFWWSIKNPEIREDEGAYRVSNSWRWLYLNRKTLMPEKQIIELEDGRQLTVLYDEPALMEGGWFPSKMRIELSHQSVNLKIKSLSLKE
jgi:hypothetical protein